MVLPLYANLEKHDQTLLDAAQDLGRQRVAALLAHHVSAVAAGRLRGRRRWCSSRRFGIFAIPDILGGPDDSLIGNVIKQQFLETRDWPFGSVLSIVLTVVRARARRPRRVGRAGAASAALARGGRCVSARSGCGRRRSSPTRSSTCRSSSSSSIRSTTRGSTPSGSASRSTGTASCSHNDEMLLAAGNSLLIALVASLVVDGAGHDGRHRDAPLPAAPAADPGADADRDPRDPDGRVAAHLLRAAQLHARARVGRARAHRVLHRLRRDRRARAARRHGREPGRGRARLRRHAAGRRSATSRCR